MPRPIPPPAEMEHIVAALARGMDPAALFLATASSPEALQKRAAREAGCRLAFPPGHYYSPIVNPAELQNEGFRSRLAADPLAEIAYDDDAMERLIVPALEGWPHALPSHRTPARRYFAENGMYGPGDAIILAAMLRHLRPKRWIEVGCGFSSAILLDTLDEDRGLETAVTFIEPNTERLEDLLRDSDRRRVTLIADVVQQVPLETFDALEAGDVLFLDTTHVCKTGSDVHHEVFRILPRLAAGVIVHFHDVTARFEYPDAWIFDENRSWNEMYVLRAFLMYNRQFDILYANAAFAARRRPVLERHCPEALVDAGAGLWLRKR